MNQPGVEPLEQPLFQPIHHGVQLFDHREVGVHGLVDDVVHRHLDPAREQLGIANQPLADELAALLRQGVHRHQEVLAQEEIQVGRRQVIRLRRAFVEADDRHHDEDVALVLLELDTRARRKRVLDGQRVKRENFFEQRELVHVGAVDVHPELAFARLEDLPNPRGGDVLFEHTVRPPVEAGRPVLRCLRLLGGSGGSGHVLKIALARMRRHRQPVDRADSRPRAHRRRVAFPSARATPRSTG